MSFDAKSLLDVAKLLIESGEDASDAFWRRSISTSYYAIFHHLCTKTTHLMLGSEPEGLRRAREHIERSIEHASLAKRCKGARNETLGFPPAIVAYAIAIYDLQEDRHRADYNGYYKYSKEDAERRYLQAKSAIEGFDASDDRHQRAFIVWANFEKRW